MRLVVVRRNESGKFSAETRDPIKKRKVLLGTFNTAEEASKAHLASRKIQPTACKESKLESSHGSPSSVPDVKAMASSHGNSESQTCNPFGNSMEIVKLQREEKAQKSKQVHEIDFDKVKMDSFRPNPMRKHMNFRRMCGGKTRMRLVGVCRRKSGKFSAEITDPIKKRKVWLGTFNSAEEASKAYLSKKQEYRTQLNFIRKIQSTACKESKLESSHGFPSSVPDVNALASCHGDSESQTCNPNGNSLETVKLESVELYEGYAVMGLVLPTVPSFPVANFGSEFFLPIMDSHGFLLGEFSKLDDLSVCNAEDENIPSSELVPGL